MRFEGLRSGMTPAEAAEVIEDADQLGGESGETVTFEMVDAPGVEYVRLDYPGGTLLAYAHIYFTPAASSACV